VKLLLPRNSFKAIRLFAGQFLPSRVTVAKSKIKLADSGNDMYPVPA
jgi:hypothetical protein